jgi:Peptidase C13 family
VKQALSELKANLLAGMDLLLLRKCSLADFRVSLDQAVLVLAISLVLENLVDFLVALPAPEFDPYGFRAYGFSLLCCFFASYLIAKIIRRPGAALQLVVIVFSAAPLLYALYLLISWMSKYSGAIGIIAPYAIAVIYYILLAVLLMRPARIVALPRKRFGVLGLVMFSVVWIGPSSYFDSADKFWYQKLPAEEEDDPFSDYREFDAEELMFSQHEKLKKTLDSLKPGSSGRSDIFFVSFASYAYEDVFLKEANYTQQLLDTRFGTKDRSVRLINHLQTRDEIPLATSTNLALTLQRIGRIMNTDEDVLVLYLTSHGSPDHKLAVRFWPLALNDIEPGMLRSMLDNSGIQWRIVIISACYSGGFVDELEDSRTLVATAAAADRASFGCSSETDFTYFGEAVFKEQLSREFSFLEAFQKAAIHLENRERSENLTHSRPQLSIGESIRGKLDVLTSELTRHHCLAPEAKSNYPVCG